MKLVKIKNLKNIQYKNRILLYSDKCAEWVKISEECYRLLRNAEENNIKQKEFIDCLEDENDKEYFRILFKYLNILNENDAIGLNEKYSINFSLTNRCNLSCKHCCVNAGSNIEELEKKEIFRIIDRVLELNLMSLTITGGEPLIRKDFIDIIKYIRKYYNGRLSLMTNGTLFNKDNIDFIIKNFDSIDISLDGVDDATTTITRGKGVFERVIRNVEELKKSGCDNISISMVINQYNYKRREEFKKLNEKLGTRGITRVYAPIGRGKGNLELLMGKEINNLEEKRIPKGNSSFETGITCGNCNAIRYKLFINHLGDIYPCSALAEKTLKLGNILEIENILKYLKNEEYKQEKNYNSFLDILEPKECKECKVLPFCIKCPIYRYAYQDVDLLKEFCKNKKEFYYEAVWGESL